MQRLEMKPDGFPLTLAECPPGFFLKDDMIGFKSEYNDVFCDSGEAFWAGTSVQVERDKIIVQPLVYEWQLSARGD